MTFAFNLAMTMHDVFLIGGRMAYADKPVENLLLTGLLMPCDKRSW